MIFPTLFTRRQKGSPKAAVSCFAYECPYRCDDIHNQADPYFLMYYGKPNGL